MKKEISLLIALFVITFFALSCTGTPTGSPEKLSGKRAAEESSTSEETEEESTESPKLAAEERSSGLEAPAVEPDFFAETESLGKARPMEGAAPAPRFSSSGESGLQAGYADDNSQFGRFIEFLTTLPEGVPHHQFDVSERVSFHFLDAREEPLSGARISIWSGGEDVKGELIEQRRAYADGTYRFYPTVYPSLKEVEMFTATVYSPEGKELQEFPFSRSGRRSIKVKTNKQKQVPDPVPLDILFVLDTTGSMGEEIDRLKATIELIHLNLGAAKPRPDLRFGMVLYKDRGDSYVTQTLPFTGELETFQNGLAPVVADGGGDGPEDLQEALRVSMEEVSWRNDGVRLAFVITDAEAHLDYADQHYTYIDAAAEAKTKGIKLYGVGTGGLPLAGEILLRQIAHYTEGNYIFLTYGETGESEGGSPGSVSHHTGANFATDKLESIIIRFAREELAHFAGKPLEDPAPFLTARKIDAETREETLGKLFAQSLDELAAYSSLLLEKESPTAILPIVSATSESSIESDSTGDSGGRAANAEYFTEQLLLAAGKNGLFKPVERKNLQAILEEQKLLLSGITEGEAIKLGRLLNARFIITGKQFEREESFEIFLNLLRVETGEVLSVTKAVLERELGL